jgi:predicted MPP superfamily phosphohydrolase
MRTSHFIIFFGIFFTAYGLINYYIFIRGWQSLPEGFSLRPFYVLIFIILALSFIGGRILENIWLSVVSDVFVWIGSFWLAAMIYFLLAISILDFLRLINHWVPLFPSSIAANYSKAKAVTALVVIGLNGLILLGGHVNALTPQIRTLHLVIPKKIERVETLNVVTVSDIHLGTVVGRRRFDKIVDRINELNPDLILLLGDIVDEDLGPVIKQNLGETLRNMKSRFGVFAITGNHEYIGGVEQASTYLIDHKIVLLRDSVVKINNSVYVVGREDRSITRFTGKTRKSLEDLMAKVEKGYPVILMDHQPFQLEQAANNGVDLQLSGHTHHGQLWPFNFIAKMVYEVSWGYKKKGNTHIYVSSGAGTWGPPVRIGNRPEIVNIKLTFQDMKGS